MRLKKCFEHGYTLKEKCLKCGKETKEAHYKFLKVRDVKTGKLSGEFLEKVL